MDDGGAVLEVGFAVDFHDSFGQLKTLDDMIGTGAAKAVREFQRIEAATKGFIDLGGATARVTSFGNALTQEMRSAARETASAEKAAEAMVRQIERQTQTFGKSASEIRNMRAELRAVAAEERGLTELAGRLRAANAEMIRLESSAGKVVGPTNAARASMQNLGFQLQDFAVQVVGGTSALRAFAMQAPQAAGSLTGFQGKIGAVGTFLAGPWGIAITLATTVLAGFADTLFDSGKAADEAKKHVDGLTEAYRRLATGMGKATMGDLAGVLDEQMRNRQKLFELERTGHTTRGGRQRSDETNEEIRQLKAYLANSDAVVEGTRKRIAAQERLNKLHDDGVAADKATKTAETAATREARLAAREAEKTQKAFEKLLDAAQGWGDLGDRIRQAREEASKLSAQLREDAESLVGYKFGSDQDPSVQLLRGQGFQVVDPTKAMLESQNAYNDALAFTADKWDLIARNVDNAGRGMADAFGNAGRAIGAMAASYADYQADRALLDRQHHDDILAAGKSQIGIDRANAKFALATATSQIGAFGDMTAAAKGFFDEKSKGYQALAAAEKVFRAVEFALSVRAMAQDAAETASKLATGAARIATGAVEAVVNAIKSLPFPLNIAAGAATVGALASIGVSIAGGFGGKGSLPQSNTGTGTVLGDSSAKSESIKRSIDALKEVDTLTNSYSREMLASLRSIDSQIGGFASLVLRTGDINASGGIAQGFAKDTTGKLLEGIITGGGILSKIPIIGGIIGGIGSLVGSLFGTKTSVVGSGLYGGPQSLGSVLNSGFDASYFSDVQKKKKFFGITTSTKYDTNYSAANPDLENQFTLILRSFNQAIVAAAGPLGAATSEIQNRLNGFVVNIGKIDLQGLSGAQIEEKLTAVFGAAADNMAKAAFPGMERFQAVGEGMFETLVRVASTAEVVTTNLTLLGTGVSRLGLDAQMALADQFDSLGDMTSAVDAYFQAFYTKEEQAAAKTAQFGRVFDSLGLAMPTTLAGFRQLVDAQNLTSEAGRSTYATLLQLAPAFADLQASMEGAKSAADILSERQDLQRQMLELKGDTAAIRALDLAKLDASNRALQEQVWAVQDAQAAAKAADDLRQAWTSVGDSIMAEVNRIRGLSGVTANGSFATLMGQFNVANAAARGGDQDIAKTLPGLSQALLAAAANSATSRQELDRVQAQTAATLEATYAAITGLTGGFTPSTSASLTDTIAAAMASTQAASASTAANDDLVNEIRALREEVEQLRNDNNAGHAATAGNTGKSTRILENVTGESGGTAIAVTGVAA